MTDGVSGINRYDKTIVLPELFFPKLRETKFILMACIRQNLKFFYKKKFSIFRTLVFLFLFFGVSIRIYADTNMTPKISGLSLELIDPFFT